MFDSATVLFSAIEGFSQIVAKSRPIEILGLLQIMCTTIDQGITSFDVYKVETITDTYMVRTQTAVIRELIPSCNEKSRLRKANKGYSDENNSL